MCLFSTPDMAAPQMPVEPAQMRAPDNDEARTAAGRRASDRLRAGTDTILTSGSGVTSMAPTEKKTLLGQ